MPRLPSLNENAALSDLFARFPGNAAPIIALVEEIMRGEGARDIAEREFIAAYASALNACAFCTGSHVIFAEAFGIAPGLIEQSLEDLDAAEISPPLREVLRYLQALNALPHRLTQADMDRVLTAGVSEAALVEALEISGLFNMMNRIIEGAGVAFDPRSDPQSHSVNAMRGAPRNHHYV
ncbi:Alkylhydroperoxidase AhpD domain protein [Candidatus Rhodobacter oscarellae]|uniref:Alkylhydroperoxidase AhpD domain protein n=1 Tax=Candidatus Rhodobacter oscarellae TaxID=1675527 RepID=A0A0J9ECK9_9RHOB|nr:hypothetical protein [Candidatus Rhodobacter lobularis]KMW59454.1 Alkylhydroperoxidase AhpD domain protein [Candidatus Rhodobacter lobularis]